MPDTTSLNVGRQALSSLVSNFLMAAVGFGGTVLFARLLGPGGFGTYRTALAVAFVCTQVSGGVGNAVQKRVAEVDTDAGAFLGAGLLVQAALTGLVAGLAFVFLDPATAYLGDETFVLGAVAVVATLGLFNVVNRAYAGLGYPARSNWLDTVRSLTTLAAQLALLWLGLEVFGLLAGLALGTLAAALLSMLGAGVRPTVPGRAVLGRVYDFARWSVPNNLLTELYSSADVLVLTAVAGSAATGLYTSAVQLVMPAAFLAGSIGDALNVKTSGRSSAGQQVDEDLLNAVSYTGLFAWPLLFGALAMPRAIPRTVFGPEFAAAGAALVGMALFQLGNVYSTPFETTLAGTDRPGVVFRVNALVLLVHLPLAVALGVAFGLLGVVGATVAAELVRNVTYQAIAYRDIGRVALTRPVVEQLLSALVMYAALRSVLDGLGVGVTGWPVLVALVGGGAVVYFLVLLAVSAHFRLTVDNVLPVDTPVFDPDSR